MRKKAEKRTPIVDKKTVHTTMAVFVKAMVMLSVIVAIFFAATPVLAANTGSQSTINTTVPDSHNIRVEKSHAIVAFEDEETRDEEGISDNFVVDRFAEPKIQITPEEGWKVSRILLNGEDVTEQFKDGYLTLEDDTLMQWCVDNDFCGEAARAVRYDDPQLIWQTVPWPTGEYIVSEKDRNAMSLCSLVE